MRLHVNMKFNSKEREHIVKFANEIGLSVDDFCKRAVFYSINDAYRRAEQQQIQEMENGNTKHDSSSGNSDGNNPEEQLLGSTTSAALSNKADAPTDSQA